MANFQSTPCYSAKFVAALQYAADIHAHQIRKQGNVPYISHLLQVCGLVLEAGGNEDEAIAALLHDAVEDGFDNAESPAYRDDGVAADYRIAECFDLGWVVADLVSALSESKHLPVGERKQGYIDQVKNGGDSVKLVSFCDKLHNLRCYARDGVHLWKAETAEFYYNLMPIYMGCDRIPKLFIEEMANLLDYMNEVGPKDHPRQSFGFWSEEVGATRILLTRDRFDGLWKAQCRAWDWDSEFGDDEDDEE